MGDWGEARREPLDRDTEMERQWRGEPNAQRILGS